MNRELANNYNTDLEDSSCSEDGEVPPLKSDLDMLDNNKIITSTSSIAESKVRSIIRPQGLLRKQSTVRDRLFGYNDTNNLKLIAAQSTAKEQEALILQERDRIIRRKES